VRGFIFNPVEGAKYRNKYDKIARDLNAWGEKNQSDKVVELVRKLCWSD